MNEDVYYKDSLIHQSAGESGKGKFISGPLPVMEIFHSIQGEGYHQGQPAWFIRLGGCDVGCSWCDVKESWNARLHKQMTIESIVSQLNPSTKMVVITGGEPLLYSLGELTNALKHSGYRTHLETSGAYPLSGMWNWITLSPKKFKAPLPEIFSLASELKVIVYNKTDFAFAEKHASLVNDECRLFLQPEWSRQTKMTQLITQYINQNTAWQLSVQLHKHLNLQ